MRGLALVALGLAVSFAVCGAVAQDESRPESAKARAQWRGGVMLAAGVAATAAGSAGLMLLAAGLLPAQVGRAEAALRRGPWKMVLVGIVGVLLLMVAASALLGAAKAGAPALGVLGGAVLAVLVWFGSIGLAATAKIVGAGLLRDAGDQEAPWRTVGAGALAIALAALVPVFGAALFVFFLCRGVGAATLAVLAPSGGPPQAEPPAATA